MMVRKIGHGKSKSIAFIAGLTIGIASIISAGLLSVGVASAASDCAPVNNSDDNAIIYCGFSSPSTFISKVKSNDSGNGHEDLQAVYAYYGLEPADYNNFVSYAEPGTVYSNGTIVVDMHVNGQTIAQTVATNTKSIGRLASYQDPNTSTFFTQPISVNGKTVDYYGNLDGKTFANGVTSLPVTVLFNKAGVMQFAVDDACGNPDFGTPVTPTYSCSALHDTKVANQANTYQFTTTAPVGNNAVITKTVYDFGDGKTATVTGPNSPNVPVTHTYTTSNTFTASVTVYVSLPGSQDSIPVTSVKCQTKITVLIPYYQCAELTGAILDKNKLSISLTATAKYGGGATFTSADFDFGDGDVQDGVKPVNGVVTVTVTHTYATANTYNASAVLHFMVNGEAVTATPCPAIVTPTAPPTPECKPGVAEGSAACTPCPTNLSVPSNSSQCTTPPPPTLPNTGAGDTIAIFSGVVVAAFLVYRQLIFRKHRAAFLAAEQGTSPLPLSDPLDEEPQPTVTPSAPYKRSLRRNRRY